MGIHGRPVPPPTRKSTFSFGTHLTQLQTLQSNSEESNITDDEPVSSPKDCLPGCTSSSLQSQQSPSLNSYQRYKTSPWLVYPLLLLVLLLTLLKPVDSFIWPFGSNSPSETKPVEGQARDEFEARLTRNVGRMSDEGLFGSGSSFHWFGFGSRNRSKDSHPSELLETGDFHPLSGAINWKFNDINALNISGEFGTLLGFGDYNSDEHVDMFFVTSNPSRDSNEGPLAISIRLWDPSTHQFVPSVLYPLPSSVTQVAGLTPIDVNLDGLVDLIVTTSHATSSFDFLVMLQDSTSRKLESSWHSADHSQMEGVDFKSTVHYVVMDINFDGYPDLVGQLDSSHIPSSFSQSGGRFVWINHHNDDSKNFSPWFLGFGETQHFTRWNDDGSRTELSPLSSPHSSGFLDLNGDCVPDLVFDVTSSSHQRSLEVWLSHLVPNAKKSLEQSEDQTSAFLLSESEEDRRTLNDSLSSIRFLSSSEETKSSFKTILFGSLFSSSLADGSYSPKIGSSQPVYVRSKKHQLDLPQGVQQVSFSDVTADGTIDVVASACSMDSKGNCLDDDRVIVFGNRQLPLCPDFGGFRKPDGPCRPSSALCRPVDFSWESTPNSSPLNPFDGDSGTRHFVGSARYPMTLRVGDFDSDGYPDVLSLVKGSSGRSEIMVFRNAQGDPKPFKSRSDSASSFSLFQPFSWGGQVKKNETHKEEAPAPMFVPHKLLAVPEVSLEAATFFDLGEDGRLDVIATAEADKSWWDRIVGSEPPKLISFLRGEDDSLFIKSTGLSGACSTTAHCYGSLNHGATFKLTGSDLSGSRFSRVSPQLSQSAYSPLQLPYTLMGLGKINNYIDYFFYGIAYSRPIKTATSDDPTSSRELLAQHSSDTLDINIDDDQGLRDTGNFHRWISLIPNSFVIANPYPRDDPSKWKLELSVSPSKYFWRILGATVISLAVIGVVICLLDSREKAEDLKELQGFRRHFIAVG